MTARRVKALAGDVSNGRARARRRGPGPAGQLRHRGPLGRHRELRLGPRRRGGGQPAGTGPGGRGARRGRLEGSHDRGVHLLCGRQPARRGTRAARGRLPLLHRCRLARRGRQRPPGPPRRRAGQPQPGAPGGAGGPGPPGAGRGRHTRAVREGGEPAAPLGQRPDDGRGPGPGREPRLPRRLRVHQGPRRAGPGRDPRRHCGEHRAALDHRVGPGRALSGVDPRIPHGRAGDRGLRPGTAQGVPRRSRGHHRRDSRRPGGGHHLRGGRPRPRRGRAPTSPRWPAGRSTRSSTASSSTW